MARYAVLVDTPANRLGGRSRLIREIRACTRCAEFLPLGPRPVVSFVRHSKILLVGQAPGTRVHATGIPWNDPSGVRLRAWLGISEATFYDPRNFAIVPMGFCYPGRGRGGDLPPRPECAATWMAQVRAALRSVRLTLLIGSYAQAHFLGPKRKRSLGETVAAWSEYLPEFFVLPHPSPRNTRWLRDRPWFERETIPALREAVSAVLDDGPLGSVEGRGRQRQA